MKILIIGVFSFLLVGGLLMYNISNDKNNNIIENVESYQIINRYGCEQIQDNKKYNECVKFYLEKSPYKLGDILVPIRPEIE